MPDASTGSVDGYPLAAITRYQAPSQIDENDSSPGRYTVKEFATWTLTNATSVAPVTTRASR
ncbi:MULTISPECIES: hypothetical protein [unclassified Curtobacterium]|uniref:hypothetical protein n=1 Tax=unclassified Curtobacterium TaxID=257496 RepID=UPI0039AFAA78